MSTSRLIAPDFVEADDHPTVESETPSPPPAEPEEPVHEGLDEVPWPATPAAAPARIDEQETLLFRARDLGHAVPAGRPTEVVTQTPAAHRASAPSAHVDPTAHAAIMSSLAGLAVVLMLFFFGVGYLLVAHRSELPFF